jgi:hypothetical protein
VNVSSILQLSENKIKIRSTLSQGKNYALVAIISIIRRKKVNTDVAVSYNESSLFPVLE